jgi:hypothetical protein
MNASDVSAKIVMQKRFCDTKGYPHFAPSDGVCYWCDRQIYDKISVEIAQGNLITGCPWCHKSYCD